MRWDETGSDQGYHSTQTQQTTSLGWVYCVAIWCMSGFSSTQVSRAMSAALFSVLTLRMCSHTIMKLEFCLCQRRQIWICNLILNNLSVANTWKERRSDVSLSDSSIVGITTLSKICCPTCKETWRGERELFPATLGAWCLLWPIKCEYLCRSRRCCGFLCRWTSQGSVQRKWEACCNHGWVICQMGPKCLLMGFRPLNSSETT